MGRDWPTAWVRLPAKDFNPLSPHGERPGEVEEQAQSGRISIHSPRMGRDISDAWEVTGDWYISIHSPRMGRDRRKGVCAALRLEFQSTLPAWGETAYLEGGGESGKYFNPLSPHGERLLQKERRLPTHRFQSTLPAWGETAFWDKYAELPLISIHSPRMGRDRAGGAGGHAPEDFNPLSPHGERPTLCGCGVLDALFQSTLPAWGET